MTCLRVMNLQIVLDALFHRFIFTKEEQWNGGECKGTLAPDKRPANTVQTGGSLWLVGNIAKAVHNPGGETVPIPLPILMQKVLPKAIRMPVALIPVFRDQNQPRNQAWRRA